MEDIKFPAWATESPFFSLVRVISRTIHNNGDNATESVSSLLKQSSSSIGLYFPRGNATTPSLGAVGLQKEWNASEAPFTSQGSFSPLAETRSRDVLSYQHVQQLLQLTEFSSFFGPESEVNVLHISVKTAPALLSVLALAVECRDLPEDVTRSFLSDCALFYSSIVGRLKSAVFLPGVNVQGFIASFVVCGLLLRDVESLKSTASVQRASTDQSASQIQDSRGGFDRKRIDGLFLKIIPKTVDECIDDAVALGVLEGLSFTCSKQRIHLSSSLVNLLHGLMDGFATSGKRKEVAFKQLLCHLLEAISCAKYYDSSRINNWVKAILQPDYVLRGLLQRESLHARVVAAVLRILTLYHRDECAKIMTLRSTEIVGAGRASSPQLQSEVIPVISLLIEWEGTMNHVWAMLYTAKSEWDDRRTQHSLQANNLRILMDAMLDAEVERAVCVHSVASFVSYLNPKYEEGLPTDVPPNSSASAETLPPVSSWGDDTVRLRMVQNITQYLMLPSSMYNMISVSFDSFRREIAERCAEVMAFLIDRQRTVALSAAQYGSLPISQDTSSNAAEGETQSYLHVYHNGLESVVEELIRCIVSDGKQSLEQTSLSLDPNKAQRQSSSMLSQGEGSTRRVAALCLQSLCAMDEYICSFAATEVLDAVVRLTAMRSSENGVSNNNNSHNNKEEGTTSARMASLATLEICLDLLCHILVSKHQSLKTPLSINEISRLAKLLCDTYESSVQEAVISGEFREIGGGATADEGRRGVVSFPRRKMEIITRSLWKLLVRMHERMRVLTTEAINVSEEESSTYVDVIQKEGKILTELRRHVLQCVTSVAWPGSGVLFGQIRDASNSNNTRGGDGTYRKLTRVGKKNGALLPSTGSSGATPIIISPQTVAPCIAEVISPFLKVLSLLAHLLTLFPVTDRNSLRSHNEHGKDLLDDNLVGALCIHHYYFQPGKQDLSTFHDDDDMAQFRTFWLMLTFYGFTGEAMMYAGYDASVNSRTSSSLSRGSKEQIRLLAASGLPLMRMRSSDYQQAESDINVLKRHLGPQAGALEKQLLSDMRRSLPDFSSSHKMTFVELFLMRSLVHLESLRASCGSIATLTQYQHFEVREFVASSSLKSVLQHVTSLISTRYLAALQDMQQNIAFELLEVEGCQLVMLFCFSIASVRESAKSILTQMLRTFPSFLATNRGLPLLWSILNVMDAGAGPDIEALSAQLHFRGSPAVAGDVTGAERAGRIHETVEFAELWCNKARAHAPLALFETGVDFVVKEMLAERDILAEQYAGSRLAVRAAQTGAGAIPESARRGVLAVAESFIPNYAQTLMRRSNAIGHIRAASHYADAKTTESMVLMQLREAVHKGLNLSSAMEARLSSRFVGELLTLLQSLPEKNATAGEGKEYGRDGKRENGAIEGTPSLASQQLTVKDGEKKSTGSSGLTSVVDSLCCAAVAILSMHHPSSSAWVELMRHVVQGPAQLFTTSYLQCGIRAWKWLFYSNRKSFAIPLLEQVVEGFTWTAVQRLGLFDGSRPLQPMEVETGDPHQREDIQARYSSDYATNSPHQALVAFLAECYVNPLGPVSFQFPVLSLLYRLANTIVSDPERLSTKDISFAEFMRTMLLVGTIISNLHKANDKNILNGVPPVVDYTGLATLRGKYYLCIGQWFRKMSPSWYFATEIVSATEGKHVIAELLRTLWNDQNRLLQSTAGFIVDPSDVLQEHKVCPPVHKANGATGGALPIPSKADDAGGAVGFTQCGLLGDSSHPARGWSLDDTTFQALLPTSVGSYVPAGFMPALLKLFNYVGLLRLLLRHEQLRLALWINPSASAPVELVEPDTESWKAFCDAAAVADPAVLVGLAFRFPTTTAVRYTAQLVSANPSQYCHIPEAVDLYLTTESLQRGASDLYLFTNCGVVQALRLLDERYISYPHVTAYAIRSLLATNSQHLIFYLPQLLQCLSSDRTGGIERFLRKMCHHSNMFTHQLLWSLRTEGEGTGELAKRCTKLSDSIIQELDSEQTVFYKTEFEFIDTILALSGELKPVEKTQRKGKLRAKLRDGAYHDPIVKSHSHLYMPTDANWRMTDVISETAGAMQSAAKCPILVQFRVIPRESEVMTWSPLPDPATVKVVKACIFKMGDDCRQDQVALQLIGLFQRILNAVEVPSYLYPYRVVTTGIDSGIIECVPHSMSRNEIGKLVESNLAEYFVQTYGHPESVAFRRARECFIRSMASYSVSSFILNIKDRHNGNIMIDSSGYLVHIDFGFLFDFSPGGDFNFESSPFKLTLEMLQLMGHPVHFGAAGTVRSASLAEALLDADSYQLFVDLTVRCYLAVRQYARQICVLVELLLSSGLPCFKPFKTIQDLAYRLSMSRTETEAAEYMCRRIEESKNNLRTRLYDRYQNFAEGIEM